MEYLLEGHWYTPHELADVAGVRPDIVLWRLKHRWPMRDVVERQKVGTAQAYANKLRAVAMLHVRRKELAERNSARTVAA